MLSVSQVMYFSVQLYSLRSSLPKTAHALLRVVLQGTEKYCFCHHLILCNSVILHISCAFGNNNARVMSIEDLL